MTTRHTPGPWSIEGFRSYDSYGWWIKIPNENARLVVDAYSSASEGNAYLISAAPELLEALEHMANQHKCGCGHPACNRCEDDCNNERVLAKAKGAIP